MKEVSCRLKGKTSAFKGSDQGSRPGLQETEWFENSWLWEEIDDLHCHDSSGTSAACGGVYHELDNKAFSMHNQIMECRYKPGCGG